MLRSLPSVILISAMESTALWKLRKAGLILREDPIIMKEKK